MFHKSCGFINLKMTTYVWTVNLDFSSSPWKFTRVIIAFNRVPNSTAVSGPLHVFVEQLQVEPPQPPNQETTNPTSA